MDPVAANAAGHTRKGRDIRKMRTRYTLINMVVNVGGQLMNQVLLFISRMVFIHYLSAAYLGVNGLFTDVLGILNLAELGVGTAMIYSLYEPAAKNDEHRLAQLMNLYRLLYRIVAVVVLLVGLALMPFLGFFIKDSSGIEHLRLIYLMYVANSVCSYLLSYKNSIYLAYQKAYVRNLWAQLCDAVKTLFQIVLIVLTGNFILYLAVQFVMQFIPNIIVSVKVDKEFPYLKECRELPEKEKRQLRHRKRERAQYRILCALPLFSFRILEFPNFQIFRFPDPAAALPRFPPSGIFSGAAASAGLSGPVMIPFHALLSADIRPGKAVFFHGEKIDLSFQPDQIIHFDFRIKQQNPAIFFNFHPSVRIAF